VALEPHRSSLPAEIPDLKPVDWADVAERVRRHRVVLGGIAMVAAACVLKAVALNHSYFQQDDFAVMAKATAGPFGFQYLFQSYAGHLIPGMFALAWMLTRISAYNWSLSAGTVLVFAALAGLGMLKALRTLFGDRPLILLPLAVYLFTPLTVPALTWWMVGLQEMPLELAIVMAVDQHVRYVRQGRLRNAIFAALWVVFGLAFNERANALPVLLLALTSAFLVGRGSWLGATRRTLRRHWRAWSMYLAAMAADIAIYVLQLNTSSEPLRAPTSVSTGATVAWDLVEKTLVPGALGGPWRWLPMTAGSSYAIAAPPALLVAVAWIAAAAVVVGSILYRRNGWRAWAILLGWVVVADIIPVEAGRVAFFGTILGFETRYVADAVPVLAICLALAIAPVAGEQHAYRPGMPDSFRRGVVGGFVAGAFLLGSLWSVVSFEDVTSSAAARSYLANARAAVAAAKPATTVLDSPAPNSVIDAGLFGRYGRVEQVLSPLTSRMPSASRIRWVQRPAGTVPDLLTFDSQGNLVPIALAGPYSVAAQPPGAPRCTAVTRRGVTIRLIPNPTWAPYPKLVWTLAIGYVSGPNVMLAVTYAGQHALLTLTHGLGNTYVTVHGSASRLTLRTIGGGVCVGTVQVGDFGASS
jgi:hypothetical protein